MKPTVLRILLPFLLVPVLVACGGSSTQHSSESRLLATSNTTPASYAAVVQQLYVAYFGRPADAGGLAFYEGILANANAPTTLAGFNAAYSSNAMVKTVIDGFGTSAESNALYGTDTNVLVNAIYRNLFNRNAEPDGAAFWAGLIDSGTYSKGQAALIIMSSAQGTDLTAVNNKVTVATAFSDALITDTQREAYSGLDPNVTVRAMLGAVADTTNTTVFQATSASIINTLVALKNGTAHHVGGTVSGLTASGLVLSNGVDEISVAANASSFTFPIQVVTGASYSVGIVSQPPGFTVVCSLGKTSGTVSSADITSVTVSCHPASAVVTTLFHGTANDFSDPRGIAVDSTGNIFVADDLRHVVFKISSGGVLTTLAGSGVAGNTNGTGTAASFNSPLGIATDSQGNVYVADTGNSLVRKITPAGVVTTYAGTGDAGSATGAEPVGTVGTPSGVTVDSSGNLYVSDISADVIRKVTPAGVITTLAGHRTIFGGHDDGTGTEASFYYPMSVAVDISGNVYVADRQNNLIRKITSSGVVTTLAGSVGQIGNADGTGTAATFYRPNGVAVDSGGNVYVADTGNDLIRKITPSGVVTTLAGGGSSSTDGTGTAAGFFNPVGIAVDSAGNLYVSDGINVRKISAH